MVDLEPPVTADPRARAATPLLSLITAQSMDEDYAHVARRRAAAGETTQRRGTPHRTAAIVVAAFGVLATTAAVQTAQGADEAQSSRTVLVARVVERRETVEQLQDRILALRSEVEESEQLLAATTTSSGTKPATLGLRPQFSVPKESIQPLMRERHKLTQKSACVGDVEHRRIVHARDILFGAQFK